ncbi:hypothetical protein ETB97_010485, partial [Aspergillus alliaceus]
DGGGFFVGEGADEAEAVGVGGELDVDCCGGVWGKDRSGKKKDNEVGEVRGKWDCEGEFGGLAIGLRIDSDDICEAWAAWDYDGEHGGDLLLLLLLLNNAINKCKWGILMVF